MRLPGSLLLLIVVALPGCGQQSPERAIYGIAHDLEHRSYASACERLFASALLPRETAAQLQIKAGGRAQPSSWTAENARCTAEIGRSGRYADFDFSEPRV